MEHEVKNCVAFIFVQKIETKKTYNESLFIKVIRNKVQNGVTKEAFCAETAYRLLDDNNTAHFDNEFALPFSVVRKGAKFSKKVIEIQLFSTSKAQKNEINICKWKFDAANLPDPRDPTIRSSEIKSSIGPVTLFLRFCVIPGEELINGVIPTNYFSFVTSRSNKPEIEMKFDNSGLSDVDMDYSGTDIAPLVTKRVQRKRSFSLLDDELRNPALVGAKDDEKKHKKSKKKKTKAEEEPKEQTQCKEIQKTQKEIEESKNEDFDLILNTSSSIEDLQALAEEAKRLERGNIEDEFDDLESLEGSGVNADTSLDALKALVDQAKILEKNEAEKEKKKEEEKLRRQKEKEEIERLEREKQNREEEERKKREFEEEMKRDRRLAEEIWRAKRREDEEKRLEEKRRLEELKKEILKQEELERKEKERKIEEEKLKKKKQEEEKKKLIEERRIFQEKQKAEEIRRHKEQMELKKLEEEQREKDKEIEVKQEEEQQHIEEEEVKQEEVFTEEETKQEEEEEKDTVNDNEYEYEEEEENDEEDEEIQFQPVELIGNLVSEEEQTRRIFECALKKCTETFSKIIFKKLIVPFNRSDNFADVLISVLRSYNIFRFNCLQPDDVDYLFKPVLRGFKHTIRGRNTLDELLAIISTLIEFGFAISTYAGPYTSYHYNLIKEIETYISNGMNILVQTLLATVGQSVSDDWFEFADDSTLRNLNDLAAKIYSATTELNMPEMVIQKIIVTCCSYLDYMLFNILIESDNPITEEKIDKLYDNIKKIQRQFKCISSNFAAAFIHTIGLINIARGYTNGVSAERIRGKGALYRYIAERISPQVKLPGNLTLDDIGPKVDSRRLKVQIPTTSTEFSFEWLMVNSLTENFDE